MKMRSAVAILCVAGAIGLVTMPGCDQEDQEKLQDAAGDATKEAGEALEKAGEELQEAGEKMKDESEHPDNDQPAPPTPVGGGSGIGG